MSLTEMLMGAIAQLFTWECLSVLIIGVVARLGGDQSDVL